MVRIRWLLVVALTLGACGEVGGEPSAGGVRLRLGYLPNITHATALVGVAEGIFARALGTAATLRTTTFNAGPEAVEALFSGALDAAYLGPNPAINAHAQSDGEAIRIVAGATSGGAFLVTTPAITTVDQLRGTTLATPQLGNTQDVALRSYLKENGLSSDTSGGGDVSVKPQANADTLAQFQAGRIDGAWVPEPWATRLVQEGGGRILVDERDRWPGARYVTTHLVVRAAFLDDHPDVVKRLLLGHVEATALVNADPVRARADANAQIDRLTQKPLAASVIDAAWANLTFTNDPVASSLSKSARDAEAAGLLDAVDLTAIYDLRLLNEVLAASGDAAVQGL